MYLNFIILNINSAVWRINLFDNEDILDLMRVKGINKKDAQRLYYAGIVGIKDLCNADADELASITGISKKKIIPWIIYARALEQKKLLEVDAAKIEFKQILEINDNDVMSLITAGVMGINDLANENPEPLSEDTGIPIEIIKEWIRKAKLYKKFTSTNKPSKTKYTKKIRRKIKLPLKQKIKGALTFRKNALISIYHTSSPTINFLFIILISLISSLNYSITNESLLISFYNQIFITKNYIIFLNNNLQFFWLNSIFVTIGIIFIIIIIATIFSLITKKDFIKIINITGYSLIPQIFNAFPLIIKLFINLYLNYNFNLDYYLFPYCYIVISLYTLIILIKGYIIRVDV